MMKIKILSVVLLLIFSSCTLASTIIKCPSPPVTSLPDGWVWYNKSSEITDYKRIRIIAQKQEENTRYTVVCVNEKASGVEKRFVIPYKYHAPVYCTVSGVEMVAELTCEKNDPKDDIVSSCTLVCPSSK